MIPVCAEYKVRAACHPHDPGGSQAFAFGYGYTKAIVQAVENYVALRSAGG